jgi:hypothetical protein
MVGGQKEGVRTLLPVLALGEFRKKDEIILSIKIKCNSNYYM